MDIAGATSSTYTLVSADGGTDVSVEQTETNALGADVEVSAAVAVDAPPSTWILATGNWNDAGTWDDASTWNDGA